MPSPSSQKQPAQDGNGLNYPAGKVNVLQIERPVEMTRVISADDGAVFLIHAGRIAIDLFLDALSQRLLNGRSARKVHICHPQRQLPLCFCAAPFFHCLPRG